jgi:hypothetical protein
VDPAPCTAPPTTPRPLAPRVTRAVAAPRRPSRRPPTCVSAVPALRRRRNRAHAATWPTSWQARTALQETAAYKG